MLWSVLLSCTVGGTRPPAVQGPATVLRLDELPLLDLKVPATSLPDDEKPTAQIPLGRGFAFGGKTKAGMDEYTTPVPIRPRGLFFYRPLPGCRLLDAATGEEVPYHYGGGKGSHAVWDLDREVVTVYVPEGSPAPTAGAYVMNYPGAVVRENQLHQALSGKAPEEFVHTRAYDGKASREGLLLPAPGSVAWELDIPPSAELSFGVGMVAPEILRSRSSDGARVTFTVVSEGASKVVFDGPVSAGVFTDQRVDLSPWSGKKVRLELTSQPGGDPIDDFVFVSEPVVATRRADPVRVLMVFIDTLRPDHLSLYGYSRETSAAIDHLGSEAVVFENARSVAPWTLPSTRALLTGRYPERWSSSDTLQQLLEERGFATSFIAGNVYLTTNFDMERDWDYHQVDGIWPSATSTTDDALAWMDAHDGRDLLLQVHYMSTHLPYKEPADYRGKYAGPSTKGLRDDFERNELRKAKADKDPELQQYVRDRYDNTIRYTTDQVQRLVERLDDNDILVVFSDHGEEFWEHGGHEHGHTLYDEVLKVPLVIRAPGLTPSRPGAPVSLMDVTPTVLELAGAPVPDGLDGRSLVPLMRAESGAEEAFRQRDLAFGHLLYGMERWGLLHEDQKWTTQEGREAWYDLAADAGEQNNLMKNKAADTTDFHRRLAAVKQREVHVGYRLNPTLWKGGGAIPGLWAMCTVPGGFQAAWAGDDPLESAMVSVSSGLDAATARARLAEFQVLDHPVADDAGAIEICWEPGWFGSREVYLVPERPLGEVGREMRCSGYLGDETGGKRGTMGIPANVDPVPGAVRLPLNRLLWDQRNLVWQFGIGVEPDPTTDVLDGADPEMASMLEALGYVADDAAPGVAPERQGKCLPPGVTLPTSAPKSVRTPGPSGAQDDPPTAP